MRTVVFDLDGTLADTAADMIGAANACFRARGLGDVLDPVDDARTAFRGARAMLRLGFARSGAGGSAEVEADYPRFMAAHDADLHVHSRLYPGAAEAVAGLKAAGYALAVCTNKPEDMARELVSRLGLDLLVQDLVGSGHVPRKPDPAPVHLLMARLGVATFGPSGVIMWYTPAVANLIPGAASLARVTLAQLHLSPALLTSLRATFAANWQASHGS